MLNQQSNVLGTIKADRPVKSCRAFVVLETGGLNPDNKAISSMFIQHKTVTNNLRTNTIHQTIFPGQLWPPPTPPPPEHLRRAGIRQGDLGEA